MSKKLFVTRGGLLGCVAKYAVQQSPYHRPDNLEIVLDRLNGLIEPTFVDAPLGVAEFEDIQTLESVLSTALRQIPEYIEWNERKNGNQAPMSFVSRFDSPDPDDDFIDLDALERNVAREIEHDQA